MKPQRSSQSARILTRSARPLTRRRTPTPRGQEYQRLREAGTRFPSVGDEIVVKWVFEERSVWWPATVLSISPCSSRKCEGEVLYHKLGDYPPTETAVVFSASSTMERLVTSVGSGSDASSWMFGDELKSEIVEGSPSTLPRGPSEISPSKSGALDRTSLVSPRVPLQPSYESKQVHRLSPSSHSKSGRKMGSRVRALAQFKANLSPRGTKIDLRRTDPRRSHSGQLNSGLNEPSKGALTSRKKTQFSTMDSDSSDIGFEERENAIEKNYYINPDHAGNSAVEQRNNNARRSDEPFRISNTDMHLRLALIERQLKESNTLARTSLSTSAQSFIVSLRWALLKALEKPLKPVNIDGLYEFGLAHQEISVTVQCDYNTFREVAAALENEHSCTSHKPNSTRVAFSPPFHTTQNGSTAADNMNILFSSLADLTSFLRIRDDNDFESLLSKEVVTETTTLLRVLGTFTVQKSDTEEGNDSIDDRSIRKLSQSVDASAAQVPSAEKSTNNVCAVSEKFSTIRLFVGTAPVRYRRATEAGGNSSEDRSRQARYTSTIFQQDCKFYCRSQKCFLTDWTVQHIESFLNVNSEYNMDGTVDGSLKTFFVLNWKRQTEPSRGKWTKDVHEVGSNSPGYIRLSVPAFFISASRNVQAISSLLDTHIETFMRVRSEIHSLSSFK